MPTIIVSLIWTNNWASCSRNWSAAANSIGRSSIVTSDHGEGFGEHGLFDHGESLYRTEIGVPLLIVPPPRSRSQGVVERDRQPS